MSNKMPLSIALTNSHHQTFTYTVHILCIHAKEIKNEFDVSAHRNLQFSNGKKKYKAMNSSTQ